MAVADAARTRHAANVVLPAHHARRSQVRGVLLGDLIATSYAIGMGIALRDRTLYRGLPAGESRLTQEVVVGLTLLVLWNVLLWTQGTRRFDVIGSGAREYADVTRITGFMFGLVVTISYVFKLEVARGFVLFTFPVGLLLLLVWRYMSNSNARHPSNIERYTPRAIVLTKNGNVDEVWDELGTQLPQFRVVANLQVGHTQETLNRVKSLALAEDADFIIVGPRLLATPGFVRDLAWSLVGFDARIVAAMPLLRRTEPQISITRSFGQRIALVHDLRLSHAQRFKKRALDLVLTVGTMPLWLPLVAVLAVLVKLTSRGPAFYSHIRVGQDGSEFRMWKLRTMVRDADAHLAELLATNEADGPLFKMEHDPRVTKFGHILRKTSLDELPQLFNVLKNDMSLVGPRPQLPHEVQQYAGTERRRFVAKPGVTGLWQISGRAKLDWNDTISLDLEYIHTWTLWLDMWVLLRTVPEVFGGRGA
jgi:exopolysaccharide biosynthesis polyprenyl glycosylphosphotransferase